MSKLLGFKDGGPDKIMVIGIVVLVSLTLLGVLIQNLL